MSPLTHRTAGLLAVLALTGCAGTSAGPRVAGPPADVGHGSVEEVGVALDEQRVACRDPRPVALTAITEQAVECALEPGGTTVLLVHFYDVAGSQAFEAETRAQGAHGVFADTWSARTADASAADLIARALRRRSRS